MYNSLIFIIFTSRNPSSTLALPTQSTLLVSDGETESVSVYARAPFISRHGYSLLSAGEANVFGDYSRMLIVVCSLSMMGDLLKDP